MVLLEAFGGAPSQLRQTDRRGDGEASDGAAAFLALVAAAQPLQTPADARLSGGGAVGGGGAPETPARGAAAVARGASPPTSDDAGADIVMALATGIDGSPDNTPGAETELTSPRPVGVTAAADDADGDGAMNLPGAPPPSRWGNDDAGSGRRLARPASADGSPSHQDAEPGTGLETIAPPPGPGADHKGRAAHGKIDSRPASHHGRPTEAGHADLAAEGPDATFGDGADAGAAILLSDGHKAGPTPVQLHHGTEDSLPPAFAAARGQSAEASSTRTADLSPHTTMPPQHEALVARSVAHQLSLSLRHMHERGIEVTLSPEELGRVRMAVNADPGGITVTIIADRAETLDLLRRHIDLLSGDFSDMGYRDPSFTFAHGGADGDQGGPPASAPDDDASRSPTGLLGPPRASAAPAMQPDGRIDLRL